MGERERKKPVGVIGYLKGKGRLWLLVGGGLCYTVGIVFYAMNKTKYMHFIWHLFVLSGSILHYFYVIQVCYL